MAPDTFRKAALALADLPLDERTAAFMDLIDAHSAALFPLARTADEVVANTERMMEVWRVGASIGVMMEPTKYQ